MMLKLLEENKWQNVLNADLMFVVLGNNGRWQVVQTVMAKECNWKSDFSTVQDARSHSGSS